MELNFTEKPNKLIVIGVRITPLEKARLDAEAKDNGTDLSKWVRARLGLSVGRANAKTGKVTLVTEEHMLRADVTAEELAARE